MAMVMQKAGRFQMRTFTDGAPLFIELTDCVGSNGDARLIDMLCVEDLHDLRYCIDRMFAKLEELDG